MKKHIKFYLKTSSNLNAFLLSHTIFIKHSALENVFLRIFSNFLVSVSCNLGAYCKSHH